MSFYIWKDIDALDYVSRIQNQYPGLKETPVADLLKKWDFYRLPGGSVGYYHDYLHPPVNGYEVLVVPQTPSIPNQPLLPGVPNGNYLVDNAQPAIKFTEIGSEAAVTGGGVMSAVSSAVATAAVGAAIGFGVGVNWFETYPEEWTQISNAVFGTDLDPTEIGQITRDTNALVLIKDGVCLMCEPLIDAIRDKLNELGFFSAEETYPKYDPTTTNITVNNYRGITQLSYLNEAVAFTGVSETEMQSAFDDVSNSIYPQFLSDQGSPSVIYTKHTTNTNTSYSADIKVTTPRYETPYTYSAQSDSSFRDVFAIDNLSGNIGTYLRVTRYVKPNGEISIQAECRELTNDTLRVGSGYAYADTPELSTLFKSAIDASTEVKYPLYAPTGDVGNLSLKVKDAFPEWHNSGVDVISGVDENGQPIYTRWLPVSLPSNKPITDGIPYDQTRAQEGSLPDDDTQVAEQVKTGTKDLTDNYPQVSTPTKPPTDNPTPSAPPITGGGGSATGLANLYNPTLAQVKQFSRWLWGSDGLNLDQLKKLLQDPMQAIIGLHVMYATPTTGADRDIQVGYINSGVTSKIVTEQYTEIDCGTVTINEYFGDARDYSPFTQVYCYLPFIGIVELNADDVVNSTLNIKYKIDVLTGCCLAQLTVKKYALDAVLYTYTGNCAVQMPITSGNYLSTVSSLLGAVVSGAAAVATGGALAPVAIGAAANALGGGARASVAMSGSLGSNAGAMGIRKPYLIIKRVESADANRYNEFYGYPTNKRVNLSQLTGYVRVKEINLTGTNATEDEQNEIVTLLKEGVIL